MFKTIRRWFCKEIRHLFDEEKAIREKCHEILKKEIASLREDLFIHKKMTKIPENMTILKHDAWHELPRTHNELIQKGMEDERIKAKEKGMSHLHTKANGDEVWAKIELENKL